MLNEGLVALAFDCRERLIQRTRLADRYADRKPDLADLCLVRMSALNPSEMGNVVFTHRIGHKYSRPGRRTR